MVCDTRQFEGIPPCRSSYGTRHKRPRWTRATGPFLTSGGGAQLLTAWGYDM